MNRPKLDKHISIKDFKDFYWLKEELMQFCRENGINTSAGKIELTNKICHFIVSDEIISNSNDKKTATLSNFDWNVENLDDSTIITDNYKNTENVREFFKQAIGDHFKFNVAFMDWMKANHGKTLREAVDKWIEIADLKKDKNYKTEIAPQFEYNTYFRDFLTDNPNLSTKDAMKSWRMKRDKRGDRKYCKDDLLFLNE